MSKTKKPEPSKTPEVIGGSKSKASSKNTSTIKPTEFGTGKEKPDFVEEVNENGNKTPLGNSKPSEESNSTKEEISTSEPLSKMSSSEIIHLINENWDQYSDEEKALHFEVVSHIAAKHGFKLVSEKEKPQGIEIISISDDMNTIESVSLDEIKTSEQILANTSEEPITIDQRALAIKNRIESLSVTRNFDHGVVTRTQEIDPIEKMRQCGRNIIEEIKKTNDYVFHKRINTNKVEMMIKQLGSAYTPDVTINNKGCQFKLRKNDVTIRFPEDENEYIQVM